MGGPLSLHSMFTCIYCLKNEPDAIPSEAHIFPDGLGGVSLVRDKVCKDCNILINRKIEQKEVAKFSFFQSIWRIKNRRGKIRGVPATVNYEGKHFKITLDERGVPKRPLMFVKKAHDGNPLYDMIGPSFLVEKKKKEIEAKNPQITWKKKDLTTDPPQSVIEIASNIVRPTLRRLAAKVAYERWGQLRPTTTLDDQQYARVRNFILTGEEKEVCCGIFNDAGLLNSILNFPVGHHGVVIIAHPNSRVLGSFVTFYGLFYFWVILSADFTALAPIDNALIEDLQTQQVFEPTLRTRTGYLLVHWDHIINPFLTDPESVAKSSLKYAISKFKKAEAKFHDTTKMKHILTDIINEEKRQ